MLDLKRVSQTTQKSGNEVYAERLMDSQIFTFLQPTATFPTSDRNKRKTRWISMQQKSNVLICDDQHVSESSLLMEIQHKASRCH